ncbi:hypothetical protein [Curtobacterium sp. BRB10]|uniref:hypothetical protein n=1 Tax=Curtobacterium sp. BRB10 TaxID=2962579 RepID=UPI0028821FF3|nr:hypothetical protein [Curtobacterium sp. BRB10]MDT0235001.1 hypothetical protein [Curtobacterium sp. BRB10]
MPERSQLNAMPDGATLTSTAIGVLGVIGGLVSTVTSVRASGARRHVERADGASTLLASIDALPSAHSAGSRFVTADDDDELRSELSRIVRENAAAYVQQNPAPVGIDFARVTVPAYFVLFTAFGAMGLIGAHEADDEPDKFALRIMGGASLLLALGLVAVTALLVDRMVKRNRVRRLAGTPGREHYFGSLAEVWEIGSGMWRNRRARRRHNTLDDVSPTARRQDLRQQ